MREEEIENRCYSTAAKNRKFTYEEIKNPEYVYWDRARYWQAHQALCLLTGLMPLEKWAVTRLLQSTSRSDYATIFPYYPILLKDINLLKNLSIQLNYAIENHSILIETNTNEDTLLSPIHAIEWAKKIERLDIAKALIDTVTERGPVTSLTLPDFFIDDVCPPKFGRVPKQIKILAEKARENFKSGRGAVYSEEFRSQFLKSKDEGVIGLPRKRRKMRPDQQHRIEFKAVVGVLRDENPRLRSLDEVKEHPSIRKVLRQCVDAQGKPKQYADKTLRKWLGQVIKNPPGRPRKDSNAVKTSRDS